jgi:antitoxin PrlF
MPATFEVESTLTDRCQATVPETVHCALRLGKRDRIHCTIRPERLQVLDAGLVRRLQSLIGDVEVDLDAALSADDE